jgi:hypothetical protein
MGLIPIRGKLSDDPAPTAGRSAHGAARIAQLDRKLVSARQPVVLAQGCRTVRVGPPARAVSGAPKRSRDCCRASQTGFLSLGPAIQKGAERCLTDQISPSTTRSIDSGQHADVAANALKQERAPGSSDQRLSSWTRLTRPRPRQTRACLRGRASACPAHRIRARTCERDHLA